MPKWYESKQKGGANPDEYLEEFKTPFSSLSDPCEVIKGSKKAVLGKIRTHWAPRESPKDLEVCEKEILAIKSNKAGCFVLFWSLLGCHGALRSFSPS